MKEDLYTWYKFLSKLPGKLFRGMGKLAVNTFPLFFVWMLVAISPVLLLVLLLGLPYAIWCSVCHKRYWMTGKHYAYPRVDPDGIDEGYVMRCSKCCRKWETSSSFVVRNIFPREGWPNKDIEKLFGE